VVHGSGGTEIELEIINGRDGPEDLGINGKMISRRISRDMSFIVSYYLLLFFIF
jgi:hypothetical protein